MNRLRRVAPTSRKLWVTLAVSLGACGGGSSDLSTALPPGDTLSPPIDTTTPIPPAPPTDTSTPPPPPIGPPPPSAPPVHTGLAFGPGVFTRDSSTLSTVPPSTISSSFNALLTAAYPPTVMAKLEAARRANDRILLGFSGTEEQIRDENGFNLEKWKKRVDQYRGFDFSSYIADGTLMGHFIMDEPSDPTNWNGHQVSLDEIEEMARYSKEIWPDLPTVIRAWPAYLKGHQWQYLDATWAQFHARFGSIDEFIALHFRDTKEIGLQLIVGLNVLAGGGPEGLPGYFNDKRSMTASQVKAWGDALLDQPSICGFFVFRYQHEYFARPDIQEAMAELSAKARSHPNVSCRR